MAANRLVYSSGDLFAGATTHISYCGTYAINKHDVIHKVHFSSFPNWVSTEQRRNFEFKDGSDMGSDQANRL